MPSSGTGSCQSIGKSPSNGGGSSQKVKLKIKCQDLTQDSQAESQSSINSNADVLNNLTVHNEPHVVQGEVNNYPVYTRHTDSDAAASDGETQVEQQGTLIIVSKDETDTTAIENEHLNTLPPGQENDQSNQRRCTR